MASSLLLTFKLLLFTVLLIWPTPCKFTVGFRYIISFGDSIADTGNALRFYKPDKQPNFALPPYGETYFRHPTGRCSDGRLIVDFIAQELGLPLVTPFRAENNREERSTSLVTGVNLAVAGATAMEDSFFTERGIRIPLPGISLQAQMNWFKDYLSTTCKESSNYNQLFATSLILVGEIGGNDYNFAFLQGTSEAEIRSTFVPEVVKTISLAINELISLGAVTLLVPGSFPFGCSPAYLTLFRSSNEEDYDSETGCLKWLNTFAEYHNKHLILELESIRKRHPNTTIIYADYYNAALDLCRSPQELGFTNGALSACCGGGGPYNFNGSVQCGDPGSKSCEDPSSYANWDGIHLTEAAYKWIARGLIHGPYTTLPLTNLYASKTAGITYDS